MDECCKKLAKAIFKDIDKIEGFHIDFEDIEKLKKKHLGEDE